MNKLLDENISLNEASHEYTLKNNPDIEFTSCTTFINYFFKRFDPIGIANKLVCYHPKYIGLSPQELVETWEKVAEEGTEIHKEIDNFIRSNKKPRKKKSKLAVEWLSKYGGDKYEIFSEAIIYSVELNLAGTVDLLIYNKSGRKINIFDWKTGKKIDKTSYDMKTGNTKATSRLLDCNFIHYSLQLSLYRYILENYYDLQIDNMFILHLNGTEVISHECEYFKDEIEEMLNYDREILRKKSEESLTRKYICP